MKGFGKGIEEKIKRDLKFEKGIISFKNIVGKLKGDNI